MEPSALAGQWRLTRRLRDRYSDGYGTVVGSLVLSEDEDGLSWHETGTLRWNGIEHPVSRDYLLRRAEDGWWVHFADGRQFHPWQPGHWVSHPCRADLYTGVVRIDAPDAWRVLWRVSGPTKDQTILTRLTR